MITVTLYKRSQCKLCDDLRRDLQAIQPEYPHHLVEVDIESDPTLRETFLWEIPVLDVGSHRLKAPITRPALEQALAKATQHQPLAPATASPGANRKPFGDRLSFWIARHYLLIINLFIFLYVGFPFLAPTLMKMGMTFPAALIYRVYSPLCHQFGFRSFFLFGAQPYYPLAQAGINGVSTFEEITGIPDLANPFSATRFQARSFTGSEQVGYKIALCERDVSIYLALLSFGLLFALTGRRLPPLHWALWLLIGLMPIGLDGFSQLFSQFNWGWLSSLLPYRESTPFLRVLTGALFGFTTAWFAFPAMEANMRETRQYYAQKFLSYEAKS